MNSEIMARIEMIENTLAKMTTAHSIAQELIDAGAYDVAIEWVKFLASKKVKK